MRHLRRPAPGSYPGPEDPLRFVLGVLAIVGLLMVVSAVIG